VTTYAKLATLAELRSSIAEQSNPMPTRGLAARAADLAADEQFSGFLCTVAAGSDLPAAILWGRFGGLVTGQPQVNALALAAVFAHNSHNPHLAANYVIRLQQVAVPKGFRSPRLSRISSATTPSARPSCAPTVRNRRPASRSTEPPSHHA
jgi:hypothetical protein